MLHIPGRCIQGDFTTLEYTVCHRCYCCSLWIRGGATVWRRNSALGTRVSLALVTSLRGPRHRQTCGAMIANTPGSWHRCVLGTFWSLRSRALFEVMASGNAHLLERTRSMHLLLESRWTTLLVIDYSCTSLASNITRATGRQEGHFSEMSRLIETRVRIMDRSSALCVESAFWVRLFFSVWTFISAGRIFRISLFSIFVCNPCCG